MTSTVATFRTVADPDQLEDVFRLSHDQPVVLFLHAPDCPVGLFAYQEMRRAPLEAAVIDVTRGQTLTRDVEQRTGVRHESPQVLVLRHGKAVWSASHFGVLGDAVLDALRGAEGEGPSSLE